MEALIFHRNITKTLCSSDGCDSSKSQVCAVLVLSCMFSILVLVLVPSIVSKKPTQPDGSSKSSVCVVLVRSCLSISI